MIKNAKRAAGFTLVELLVVIGIIALLISILLPTLAKARDSAYTTKCMATLHSLGEDFAEYISAYGAYPPSFYEFQGVATGTTKAESDTDSNVNVYTWWSIIRGFIRKNGNMDNSTIGNSSSTSVTRFMQMFDCPLGHNPTAGCKFGANPAIMPDMLYNQYFPTTNPPLGPARPSGVYFDNVVLWDATEIPPLYNTQFVEGYYVDYNANVVSNLMSDPKYPSHWFRDNIGQYNGKPLLGDGYPIYVYSDSPTASSPPPLFAEGVNGGTKESALGVPCWRHSFGTACNFLYTDGSVKTLHVKFTGNTNTPWTCELMRSQLRIKWPQGFTYLPAPNGKN
jgi:prepilin-type N-terminal cleavage/methylation domain-containing protein/prepilin-type processing-associated H-X9-DG protein